MSDRPVWTYYISRNSADGVPSATVDVWPAHPTRVVRGTCAVWELADGPMNSYPAGHLKQTTNVTEPDNDRELIVCERWAEEEKVQAKTESKPRKKKMDYHK